MDGYLVMLRHRMDDLPLLLTGDLRQAMQFAKKVTDEDGASEKKLLGLDSSTPVGVWVYEFEGGRLTNATEVQRFSE